MLSSHRVEAQSFAPVDVGATVNGFQDDFNGTSPGPNWVVHGANVFSVSGGLLHIASASGDPNHLLYELPGYHGSVQEVLARIMVRDFGGGPYSRGGVAVAVDPATSQGINHTFRDVNSEGQTGPHTALLDDFRAWGPGLNFVWQTNVWYWLRQEPNAASQGGITGKLDTDGETLRLQNAIGDAIFEFSYNDRQPWPTSADGAGDSLHRIYFGDPTNAVNWCSAAPTPGAPVPATCRDSDDDGLPDAWELAHGLNENDPDGDNGPDGDSDHDSLSNLKEYLAGTDPRDAQSYLKIESISLNSGVILAFNTVSNKSYTVQITDALGSGPWLKLADIPARETNRVAVIADTEATTNRFYRLTTPQQP